MQMQDEQIIELPDGSVISYRSKSIVFKRNGLTKMVDREGNLMIIKEEGVPVMLPLSQATAQRKRYNDGFQTYRFPEGTVVHLNEGNRCCAADFSVAAFSSPAVLCSAAIVNTARITSQVASKN